MANSNLTTAERSREIRLRRMADRRGLVLSRSRRRDTGAADYGLYSLAAKADGQTVVQGLTMAAAEAVLGAVQRPDPVLTREFLEVLVEALRGRLGSAEPAVARLLAPEPAEAAPRAKKEG